MPEIPASLLEAGVKAYTNCDLNDDPPERIIGAVLAAVLPLIYREVDGVLGPVAAAFDDRMCPNDHDVMGGYCFAGQLRAARAFHNKIKPWVEGALTAERRSAQT
jgi:hypothetical protein